MVGVIIDPGVVMAGRVDDVAVAIEHGTELVSVNTGDSDGDWTILEIHVVHLGSARETDEGEERKDEGRDGSVHGSVKVVVCPGREIAQVISAT